jgi:hypothetical protein
MTDFPKSPELNKNSSSNPFEGHIRWSEWSSPLVECRECRFFDAIPGTDAGICHRYPHQEVVEREYWCGEFVRNNSRMENK